MIIDKMRRVAFYLHVFEGRGAISVGLDQLFRRQKIRLIKIKGIALHVRTASPDITVAISCLYYDEFGGILARNPKIIIDAGANIGASTVAFAEHYPRATVIALEPELDNFELLVRNTKLYPNIIPINVALWGASEERELYARTTGYWGYSLFNLHDSDGSAGQLINCVTIPELMRRYSFDRIDLMKMDIEGAEKNVLENAKHWIEKVEIVLVELHERLVAGCESSFYEATKKFERFEKHGEKMVAYRNAKPEA